MLLLKFSSFWRHQPSPQPLLCAFNPGMVNMWPTCSLQEPEDIHLLSIHFLFFLKNWLKYSKLKFNGEKTIWKYLCNNTSERGSGFQAALTPTSFKVDNKWFACHCYEDLFVWYERFSYLFSEHKVGWVVLYDLATWLHAYFTFTWSLCCCLQSKWNTN